MIGARGRRCIAASALTFAVIGACGAPPEPRSELPGGTLVIARREAAALLLGQLQDLSGSRLARTAAALAANLPDCEWLEMRAPEDAGLLDAPIGCFPRDGGLAALELERGESDVAFALPERGGARAIGTLRLTDDGGVDVRVRIPRSAFSDARALLKPSPTEPGPNLLSHADELIHARVRPEGGLDIASLVPKHGQGDLMFRLKSEIFAGAVLDGTWEMAIYLPEPAARMPRAALAVGFSLREPAVAAMERFISDLQESWPVRRTPLSLEAGDGACLRDLNLLPDLAPCYVATRSALVVGWNVASLDRALRPGTVAGAAPHSASQLHVDLSRFSEADARFAAAAIDEGAVAVSERLPWDWISADGLSRDDEVDLHIRFDRGDGA